MSLLTPFRDPALAHGLLAEIARVLQAFPRPVTLMEVCGTHTMAICQQGLRSLLPPQLRLVSGPGCPVCVTPVDYVDHAVALARRPETIIATFGDMLRVPGSTSSLQREQAAGARVQVVYSPLDAEALAARHPDRSVVFLGVGFETTAPTVAGAVVTAQRRGLRNFFVLCAHKTIPPAMALLAGAADLAIDGFLCPAHVAAIIGADAFRPLAERQGLPCVVTGFEPLDILQGVLMLVRQVAAGQAQVENQYRRVVRSEGNRKAQALLAEVFAACPAGWRGIGEIPASGLRLRPAYASFDAGLQLPVAVEPPREPPGCRCGAILTGRARPRDCQLFGTLCTPETPVGACMVSSEGTCAAMYKYG